MLANGPLEVLWREHSWVAASTAGVDPPELAVFFGKPEGLSVAAEISSRP
jgi:hypothetical protein